MKHLAKFAIPVFLVGFLAGCGFWFLYSPLLFDRVVSEELPAGVSMTSVATGQFRGADGAHRGAGQAEILKIRQGGTLLRLTDFHVTNGIALEAWLVSAPDPLNSKEVLASTTQSLGLLHGNRGDQTYVVPSGTDMEIFHSVVIWCAKFGMLYAIAPLSTKSE